MLLQVSQGISQHLAKNQCRINIPIVAWEYERNIQPIYQCTRVYKHPLVIWVPSKHNTADNIVGLH